MAQLDQLYTSMLMLIPSLPELYKSIWKKDMKNIIDILIKQFYSEQYQFFWGTEDKAANMRLGTERTDFGYSVKIFWVFFKVSELLDEPFYIEFARPKIARILKNTFVKREGQIFGSYARRFKEDGEGVG